MELRERVQSAIYAAIPEEVFGWSDDTIDGERIAIIEGRVNIHRLADAAVAAVLDALKEPSEGMLSAVVTEPTHLYGVGSRGAKYERDMKNAVGIEKLMKRQDWQAMLAAFRTEALGEG